MVLTFLFLFGLAIGSFLNVLVLRFNTGETLRGRSRCFSCLKKLEWIDLVPLASYLVVRGRCRYCGSGISIQYPIVELITGVVFVLIGRVFFMPMPLQVTVVLFMEFLLALVFFSALIAVSVYDVRHKIIPDELSVFLFSVALFFEGVDVYRRVYDDTHPLLARLYALSIQPGVLYDVLGALGAFTFFAGIWFLSRGAWMGFGDAKLALSLGLFLGYPAIVFAVVFAFWIGALFAIGMLLFSSYSRKTEVPFAPFLAAGTLVAFLLVAGNAVPWFYSILGVV